MELPVSYVFTHDSIGLGGDGPTHQPVEQLASLRAIPHLLVFRPADAQETAVGWHIALARKGPTALVLTRQAVPALQLEASAVSEGAARGAYVVSDPGPPDVILIATGSEVHVALEAARSLAAEAISVRVVSMPSQELFAAQPETYRDSVLPPAVTARVAIEAGVPFGWDRYTGLEGEIVGLERFGASAPYQVIYRELGITPEAVALAAKRSLQRRLDPGPTPERM
jgi:transketolase